MHPTKGIMQEEAMIVPSGKNINIQTDLSDEMMQEVRAIIGKLRWDQSMLRQAIGLSLRSCGEPVMKTVLWHMETQGIFLDSNDRIDMRLFYENLESLIGSASVVVMDEIVERLIRADNERAFETNRCVPNSCA